MESACACHIYGQTSSMYTFVREFEMISCMRSASTCMRSVVLDLFVMLHEDLIRR